MPFQTHNPRLSDQWTTERIALLLRLDAENILSRAQIANELYQQTGSVFSRNAVIGKLSRLGAPKKERKPPLAQNRKADKITIRPRLPAKPSPLILLESKRLKLLDLEPNDCRFPTNAEPFEFCGHPKFGQSYCAAHMQISYYAPRQITQETYHRRRINMMKVHRSKLLKPQCEPA